ncbi:MAG: hypothetical protein LBS62_05620 [Clostridiales bacterium]|jgi:YegS/Rv2252/BmrU family lipid kinase|nr:hypothetical protein [Clostridiales bacterium]
MKNETARFHLFIVNPISFSRQADMDALIARIKDYFAGGTSDASEEQYSVHISRFPRDAIRTIRQYARQRQSTVRVYAVGGDGILFDCLNGIAGLENTELAIVPYGRSNDFVRAFGEDFSRFRDIAAQAAAPVVPTDIIDCGNNYALNTCTIGMEAYTVHKATELNTRYKHIWDKLPWGLGRFMYSFMFWLGGVLFVTSHSSTGQQYAVSLDGEDFSGGYTTINIANGPCYGGDKCAAICAAPDDGLLDVLLFKSASRLQIIRMGTRYIYGNYREFPDYIIYKRAKVITVRSEKPMVLQLDGEIFFDTNIKIRIIPAAVRIAAANHAEYERRALLDE